MKTRTCFQALFCFLLAAWISGATSQSCQAQANASGVTSSAAPIVRLQALDGRFYDIADLHGEVLLLSFGATWCGPCAKELVALEELKQEYRNKPVKFFWISIDNPGQASDGKLRAYAREHSLTITVLRDPTRTTYMQFARQVRLPMTAFFGKDGRFVAPTQVGMSVPEDSYKMRVKARLDALLAQSSSDAASN